MTFDGEGLTWEWPPIGLPKIKGRNIMLKKIDPIEMESKKDLFAERLGQALSELAGRKDDRGFYRVLNALFNRGYADEEDAQKKSLAGFNRVHRFMKKIENWAGSPMKQMQAASTRGDTEAGVMARTHVYNTAGLPSFDAVELATIRDVYLKPEAKRQMEEFDDGQTRRVWGLGIGAAIGVASLPGLSYLKSADEEKSLHAKVEETFQSSLAHYMPAIIGPTMALSAAMILINGLNLLVPDKVIQYSEQHNTLRQQVLHMADHLGSGLDPLLYHIAHSPDIAQQR
jgi:hypothetical protein